MPRTGADKEGETCRGCQRGNSWVILRGRFGLFLARFVLNLILTGLALLNRLTFVEIKDHVELADPRPQLMRISGKAWSRYLSARDLE